MRYEITNEHYEFRKQQNIIVIITKLFFVVIQTLDTSAQSRKVIKHFRSCFCS